MAESLRDKSSRSNKAGVKNESFVNVECAVCLQTSIHPAELPCGHIFCYLCIKGIVNQGRRCAMCRQDIPVDYLDKPRLLKPVDIESNSRGFEDGRLWFYEGHNGWWQYDERTSLELESAYQKGERCCELLIAGFLYIADFDAMLQYRRNDPCRRRRIKRDLATISSKGVAGLKAAKDNNSAISNPPDLVSNVLIPDLQSLHISGRPLHSHLNRSNFPMLPNLTSLNFNRQQLGSVQSNIVSSDRSLSMVSPSNTCSATPLYNSDLQSSIESNNTLPSRNFELDSAIHDTLDWTIEQIEALNLELSNDYENLFSRVNSYGRLQNNVDIDRSTISSDNSPSQVIISNGELGSALENDSYSTSRIQTGTRLNCSEGSGSASSQLAATEFASLPHRITERPFMRPSLLANNGESTSASRSRVSSRNGCKKITSEQL